VEPRQQFEGATGRTGEPLHDAPRVGALAFPEIADMLGWRLLGSVLARQKLGNRFHKLRQCKWLLQEDENEMGNTSWETIDYVQNPEINVLPTGAIIRCKPRAFARPEPRVI
jgi:hypothetical protein